MGLFGRALKKEEEEGGKSISNPNKGRSRATGRTRDCADLQIGQLLRVTLDT